MRRSPERKRIELAGPMNHDFDRSAEKLPMTSEGFITLKEEIGHRLRVERSRIAERIREAIADDPNLPENAEYQAAISEQNVNDARIAELQDKLARAEVIDVSELSGDTVKFGATVTVVDGTTLARNGNGRSSASPKPMQDEARYRSSRRLPER